MRFDADLFYLDFDSPNRAGQHLKSYLKRWAPPEFGDFGAPTDLLRSLPRHVRSPRHVSGRGMGHAMEHVNDAPLILTLRLADEARLPPAVKAFIREHQHLSAEALIQALYNAVKAHTAGTEQSDDLAARIASVSP